MNNATKTSTRPRVALLVATLSLLLATCAPTLATLETSSTAEEPARARDTQRLGTRSHVVDADVARSLPRLAPPPLPTEAPGAQPDETPQPSDDALVPLPTAQPSPSATFQPVQTQQPKLRIDGAEDGKDVLASVLKVDGVSFATSMRVGDIEVVVPRGVVTVRAAAIDPPGFRVLTPQVTADAVPVWQRLTEGDVAFTHDVGYRLDLKLGERVPAGHDAVRVGALASNGVPPVAEAIMSHATAEKIGLDGERSVLVAVRGDAQPRAVADAIAKATGLKVDLLAEPKTRRAFITGNAARKAFEPYTYIDNGDGMIQIDPAWVRRNIVSAKVPIFTGRVVCHRLMIDQLRGALQEIVDRGLDHLIDPTQYGGCWVPRHIDFNPRKPLSMHSWGLAVDFNVSTNGLGQVPQMDPRIVEVFDRWGFVWGGRWKRPDGMHFELGALLDSTGG